MLVFRRDTSGTLPGAQFSFHMLGEKIREKYLPESMGW